MGLIKEMREYGVFTAADVGTKAYGLIQLSCSGILVPKGFVLPHSVFLGDVRSVLRPIQQELVRTYEGLLAIRSSFVGEGEEGASFAGQLKSVIGIKAERFINAVIRVGASRKASGVNRYIRIAHTVTPKCAVLVQELVDSQVSGVLFTNHPITKASDEVVIESTFGHNSPLASGTVIPDLFVINRVTRRICFQKIGRKEYCVTYDCHGRLKQLRPSHSFASKWSLNQAQLLALLSVVQTVGGTPCEIEWTFDLNDKLYVLQKRAIARQQA